MLAEGIKCPACHTDCKLSFEIADTESTNWIFCSCGSVFHQKAIEKGYFDQKYLDKYKDFKGIEHRFEYFERVYMPIVEELTYGRRFLDVGFGCDYHIKNLRERGWIASGIDLISNYHMIGDFETHKFGHEKYDFILMGQVLESFKDPLAAIFKAKELLFPKGVLAIVTPDAELIYKIGMWQFGNWNSKEKWILFSEKQLKRILDAMGFNVILSHKVTEQRFLGWNHMHILAQKRDE